MRGFIKLTMLAKDGYYGKEECPCYINPEFVRCFYPRRKGQIGTRITFDGKTGFPVREPFEQVARKIAAAGRKKRRKARRKGGKVVSLREGA